MKIKICIEIEKELYEKVKNLESIGELKHTNAQLETKEITFERFIEIHIEKLFKYSTIARARKDIKLYWPNKKYSLDRAIQIMASLYSERVSEQIKKEIEEK